jgi:outer membrane lipoprotein-sorting protein
MSDVEAFKTRLSAAAGSTSTIVCDFIQEKNLVVLSEKVISKGQFYFMKENNIRWEYLVPYKYLIIISNDQLFTRDNNYQKQFNIQSNSMFREINRFISGCIQGEILKNDKEYTFEYYETVKNYHVILVPHSEKMIQMISEVRIWFDKNDLTVSGLELVEPGQDYTRIEFINKKLNVEIPIEKFSFK